MSVLQVLQRDPEIVQHIDFIPVMLPDLITFNPKIASDLLIAKTNLNEITAYYDQLSNMMLNINALEVFNKLIT